MKKILSLLLLFFCSVAFGQAEPLPADQAFQFSAAARDAQTIVAHWKIQPGYYLYRERFHFHALKPENARLAQPLLPTGIQKSSPDLGTYEVYQGELNIAVPVITPQGKQIIFEANYQGCSEAGYCYPPTTKIAVVDLAKNYGQFRPGIAVDVAAKKPSEPTHTLPTPLNKAEQLLHGSNLWGFIFGFLLLGILIAFTPCVLPMIPVLSAIITAQKKVTTAHAFTLSLFYVLGMAITYAIAGLLVGLLGESIQVALQQPWVIILFSLLFVTMAFSLFGFYHIELPQRWRHKIATASEHQKRGTYFGVFMMGVLSTLILSPCVTPPLIGVLTYIGHTGNATLGGLALFIMGIGMGLPLLIIGFSHGKLLPKTGHWMNGIKNFMGILMLALAVWMLQRILPGAVTLLMWAVLAIGTAIYFGALSTVTGKWPIIRKGLGILLFVYGILLIVSAMTGHDNPLRPLQFTQRYTTQQLRLHFQPVKTIADVEKQLSRAKKQKKLVLLDFYADWCISCKEMDDFTFSNPQVQKQLSKFILLRANVTKNDAQDKALEQHFNVIAPPTILFFQNTKELHHYRIIGEMGPEAFLNHLNLLNSLHVFK